MSTPRDITDTPEDAKVGTLVERRKGEECIRGRVTSACQGVIGSSGPILWNDGGSKSNGWTLWLVQDVRPQYEVGAIYRVRLDPEALWSLAWRTADGWAWSSPDDTTAWSDATWPDAVAERVHTYDPETQIVMPRAPDPYDAACANAAARRLEREGFYATADLLLNVARALETGADA